MCQGLYRVALPLLLCDESLYLSAGDVGERHLTKSGPEEASQAKAIVQALAQHPDTWVLIGVQNDPASLIFAQSPGGPQDMGGLLRQVLAPRGGKGGGSRDFAQGGGFPPVQREEALALAEQLL